MTKILVHVTKEVLEKTKYCASPLSKNCAVAYAVRDLFPEASVGSDVILFCFFGEEEIQEVLPVAAQEFIAKFDCLSAAERILMPEISFEINVPDKALEGIDISQVHRIIAESKTLELV